MIGQAKIDVSVFQKPKEGNSCCGDSYFFVETEKHFICALADGLGSGVYAMESSRIVMDIIKRNHTISVEEIVNLSNQMLIGKRGVVLGVLKIDFTMNTYSFWSIGNIGIITINKDREKVRNIPIAGYLSGYRRPIKVKSYKLEKGTTFIMYSDGVEDKELSPCFYTNKNVKLITKAFELTSEKQRKDDTTLIAMRY